MSSPHTPGAPGRWDFFPWRFRRDADPAERIAQEGRHATLAADGAVLAADAFIAPSAAVEVGELEVGERAYVAAHAYLSGSIRLGADSTVNPFTVVRGNVSIGRAVRIGAHTSILGFNHSFADLDTDMFTQPHSSRGITIGDDVWIGSGVTIVDGVTVGDHSVIGAAAVVTRDVPAWAVVAGNPARVIKDRRGPSPAAAVDAAAPATATATASVASSSGSDSLAARLGAFQDRVREQVPTLLARSFDPSLGDAGLYRDPAAPLVTIRAQCDAIEISQLMLRVPPVERSAEQHIALLQGWQSPTSGLVAEIDADGVQRSEALGLREHGAEYHVLCVGYALDVLGSAFAHPVQVVADLGAADLVADLESLDWVGRGWGSGSYVDTLGTAVRWNAALGVAHQPGTVEALFGWISLNADPATGLWSGSTPDGGWMQAVNGFYRGSRGTYAQFGVEIPHADALVDTVLRHASDQRYFGEVRENACNVLDIVHPLWLARHQTDHRSAEVTALGSGVVELILSQWVDDRGFAFIIDRSLTDTSPRATPGLQGTEMWLSVLWLAADLAGLSDALSYRPRGIHRPEPALSLRRPLF